MMPSRTTWGIGACVILGLVAAAVVAQPWAGFVEDPREPPCGDDWTLHPREDACVKPEEVCHAWFQGVADEPFSCDADSLDGNAHLWVDAQGAGRLAVTVHDAAGARVFSDAFTFSYRNAFTLTGDAGAWRLDVDFDETTGQATVELWG